MLSVGEDNIAYNETLYNLSWTHTEQNPDRFLSDYVPLRYLWVSFITDFGHLKTTHLKI